MASFKKYLIESEQNTRIETEDSFDFIINESSLVSTTVSSITEDSIILETNISGYSVLSSYDLFESDCQQPNLFDSIQAKVNELIEIYDTCDESKKHKISCMIDELNQMKVKLMNKDTLSETDDDLEKYHSDLSDKIKHGVAGIHARVALSKAKDPETFKWKKGTLVYSPKTGKTYEILDYFVTKKGEPRYIYRSSDEQGHFIADKAHKLLVPLTEAKYQGKEVSLNKPSAGDVKKYKVYVKDPSTGNIKKVNFGDKGMEIKRDDPERRKAFRSRHGCDKAKDKTTPKYWSCKMWSSTPVNKILGKK